MKSHLFIVDDDDVYRTLLADELQDQGFRTTTASGLSDALRTLDGDENFDVAVLDLHLGDGDGMDVLKRLRAVSPQTEAIVLTGHGTIDTAIAAMRAGAYDYVAKPCSILELKVVIEKALERRRLVERNAILQAGLQAPPSTNAFIGSSEKFTQARALIERVAASGASVLILGETGVGKEVVARRVHEGSPRKSQPFVVVDCTTLHDDLLHSELFGHEKGAYTGATERKHGLFEVADGGTMFLDEIGDLSLGLQQKLLRVLETGSFRHVGGTREIHVDARLVAATNRNLEEMIAKGQFRSDLYYRLGTLHIEIPPLRERLEDIPILAKHFLARIDARFGQARRFSLDALSRLQAWHWPGNVRELLHAVEAAAVLATGDTLEVADLPRHIRGNKRQETSVLRSLDALEREHIVAVLQAVGGNRHQAASVLGISERTLYRKLGEYGLESGE
jgi:DNA-binding NtrC family response regulator